VDDPKRRAKNPFFCGTCLIKGSVEKVSFSKVLVVEEDVLASPVSLGVVATFAFPDKS